MNDREETNRFLCAARRYVEDHEEDVKKKRRRKYVNSDSEEGRRNQVEDCSSSRHTTRRSSKKRKGDKRDEKRKRRDERGYTDCRETRKKRKQSRSRKSSSISEKRTKSRKYEMDEERYRLDKKRRKERQNGIHRETAAKENRKETLNPIGPIVSSPPDITIDPEEDYFSFHPHLRLYLYRTSGVFFEDLTSTQARKAFATFCKTYNEGKLEEAYYSDISQLPKEALEQCKRTRHAWNFKTTTTEEKSLDMIKAGVQKQTQYEAKLDRKQACLPKKSGVHAFLSNKSELQVFLSKKSESGVGGRAMVAPRQEDTKEERKDDHQRAMLQTLGLSGIKPGQKISIAERKDQ